MILDQYGREIKVEEREVSGLLDVFGRWQDVGGRWAGQLLEYQDKILLEEGGSDYLAYEIYERVLSDDQVIACLQQRFGIQQEYEVVPGDDSRKAKKAAAMFEENLKNLRWDLITYQMKFGFFFGKAIAEIIWEIQDDMVLIKDILVRDRRRFRFAKDKSLRLLTATDTYNGINLSELYPAKFWVFQYGGTHSDMPDGLGLAHYLYWPVTFKRQGIRFWLYALEKYGTNIPVAYYPAGITDEEREKLAKALVRLKHNSAVSIPEGTKLEFLSGSSGIDNYEKLVQWADEAIAKVILTNTMTVEQGSSRAQAQVHEHKANSIIDSDNDLLCESFNRSVMRWWTWFNFDTNTPPPQIWRVKMSADTVRLVQRDKILYDMGFPPRPEYIKETYGEGFVTDDMLSGTNEKEMTSPGLNGAQISALTTLLTAGGRGDLPPDTLKAALLASFPGITPELAEQMVAPLRKAAEEKQTTNSPPDWNALLGSPPPDEGATDTSDRH